MVVGIALKLVKVLDIVQVGVVQGDKGNILKRHQAGDHGVDDFERELRS